MFMQGGWFLIVTDEVVGEVKMCDKSLSYSFHAAVF